MSKPEWSPCNIRAGDLNFCVDGMLCAWVTPRNWARLTSHICDTWDLDKQFDTQAEAKEYIEGCYALWIASGRGV